MDATNSMDFSRLLTAFYIVTGEHRWGRNVELSEAFKSARIKPDEKHVHYILIMFCFKPGTSKETMRDVLNCYYVDFMGIVRKCEDVSVEDQSKCEQLVGFSLYDNKDLLKPKRIKKQKVS